MPGWDGGCAGERGGRRDSQAAKRCCISTGPRSFGIDFPPRPSSAPSAEPSSDDVFFFGTKTVGLSRSSMLGGKGACPEALTGFSLSMPGGSGGAPENLAGFSSSMLGGSGGVPENLAGFSSSMLGGSGGVPENLAGFSSSMLGGSDGFPSTSGALGSFGSCVWDGGVCSIVVLKCAPAMVVYYFLSIQFLVKSSGRTHARSRTR